MSSSSSSSSSLYEGCSEIFVGGGWAGVYSFYRRIMDDPNRASSACLFEQSWRIGGRTYSVPVNNTHVSGGADDEPITQDVGAYRFSPDMHLPGDLILHDLKLPTECYQPGCPSARDDLKLPYFNYTAPLRRIVSAETGLPAGYATALHHMIEHCKVLGGRVFLQTSLTGLHVPPQKKNSNVEDDTDSSSRSSSSSSVVELEFLDSVTGVEETIVNPSVVVLNLPRNKLFAVRGVEGSLSKDVAATLKCTVPHGTDVKGPMALTKAYLYYDNAWWHTVLNVTSGWYPNQENHWMAQNTSKGVSFNIRWHDGAVSCTRGDAVDAVRHPPQQQCHGLLEAYYSESHEDFWYSVSPSSHFPFGSLWASDGAHAEEKLRTAHEGLMELVQPLFAANQQEVRKELAPPSGMMVGVWRVPTKDAVFGGDGYTAPTKVMYDPPSTGGPDRACGVAGLTDERYRDWALQPWGGDYRSTRLFLANNDWSCLDLRYEWGDWAEESLMQAERALRLLGTPKPDWLDPVYYQTRIVSMLPSGTTTATATATSTSTSTATNDTYIDWGAIGRRIVTTTDAHFVWNGNIAMPGLVCLAVLFVLYIGGGGGGRPHFSSCYGKKKRYTAIP